jgi:hypothetical protein
MSGHEKGIQLPRSLRLTVDGQEVVMLPQKLRALGHSLRWLDLLTMVGWAVAGASLALLTVKILFSLVG